MSRAEERAKVRLIVVRLAANPPTGMTTIRQRRLQRGITLKEFAARVDVPTATVANWEHGRNWPSAYLLPNIAQALHCTIEDLYLSPEEVDED